MPNKNRVIYNLENLSVGPAPASGYTFIDSKGNLNNNLTDSATNFNLVFPIYRVQNFDYNFDVNYYEFKSVGFRGTIDRQIIEQPVVNFNFSYIQIGVGIETRLGFYANHPQYGLNLGAPKYSNNFGVFCLSGFLDQTPEPEISSIRWPLSYRDRRNFFLSVAKTGGSDINTSTFSPNDVNVIGFGNCYITNWSAQGAVKSLPIASVTYIGENTQFYNNGSGGLVPALLPKSGLNVQGVNFKVPSHFETVNLPNALKPGDISINIQAIPSYTGISTTVGTGFSNGIATNTINSLGPDFSSTAIQSYNLSLDLNREVLRGLNFKLPVDRKVVFPVVSNLSFSLLENELTTGSFVDIKNQNLDYNISLKINQPNLGFIETGISVQYDLLRAKFNNSSRQSNIGNNNVISLNYSVELMPENLNRGLFISGLLNLPRTDPFTSLLEENGAAILEENGNPIYDADGIQVLY